MAVYEATEIAYSNIIRKSIYLGLFKINKSLPKGNLRWHFVVLDEEISL